MNKIITITIIVLLAAPAVFGFYSLQQDIEQERIEAMAGKWLDRYYPNHIAYYCNKGGCAAQVDSEIIAFVCSVKCKRNS